MINSLLLAPDKLLEARKIAEQKATLVFSKLVSEEKTFKKFEQSLMSHLEGRPSYWHRINDVGSFHLSLHIQEEDSTSVINIFGLNMLKKLILKRYEQFFEGLDVEYIIERMVMRTDSQTGNRYMNIQILFEVRGK